ncbi:hypothetical protein BZA77DRAFT_357328 [Pyronema omphalodes]|nr:hypothetical protein BZA77DRAFT_357328 [Pyronema omphalodes]
MRFTTLAILSLTSFALAAPSAPAPDAPITSGSKLRFNSDCTWSTSDEMGTRLMRGVLSCCKQSNLMECVQQPFNVDCKKKGWTETCCLSGQKGVEKNGGGGKCSKEGQKFDTLAS